MIPLDVLRCVAVVWGIEAIVTIVLLSWCGFCDRKFSKKLK